MVLQLEKNSDKGVRNLLLRSECGRLFLCLTIVMKCLWVCFCSIYLGD